MQCAGVFLAARANDDGPIASALSRVLTSCRAFLVERLGYDSTGHFSHIRLVFLAAVGIVDPDFCWHTTLPRNSVRAVEANSAGLDE